MVANKKLVLMRIVVHLRIVVLLLLITARLPAQNSFTSIDYRKADSCAHALRGHALHDLAALSAKLTNGLNTEVEKFRAIFTWVAINIGNDRELFVMNKRKREKLGGNAEAVDAWNREMSARTMKTMIEQRRTVCTGYAYLVRKLSMHAGIQCEIIHGYGRTVESNIGGQGILNHSWNAVRLNNTWHLCDPTWASGAYDREKREVVSKYEPSYFLAAPELFVRNHYPVDTTWILLDQKPTLREFLDGPIIYVNAFRSDIHPQSPTTMHAPVKKGETVSVSFDGPNNLEKELWIMVGQKEIRTQAKTTSLKNGRTNYAIAHRFSSKGNYNVHIIGRDGPMVTWRLIVE
jgi:transglutaminase/protease-like cytokinesis protein 3